jgi:hypothetical protein
MTHLNLRHELETPAPLLPSEKKLVAWSLGTGVALLIALAVHAYYGPAGL